MGFALSKEQLIQQQRDEIADKRFTVTSSRNETARALAALKREMERVDPADVRRLRAKAEEIVQAEVLVADHDEQLKLLATLDNSVRQLEVQDTTVSIMDKNNAFNERMQKELGRTSITSLNNQFLRNMRRMKETQDNIRTTLASNTQQMDEDVDALVEKVLAERRIKLQGGLPGLPAVEKEKEQKVDEGEKEKFNTLAARLGKM